MTPETAQLVSSQVSQSLPLAWALARNEADANDLVQETGRRVICNWKRYDKTMPMSAWFNAIMRNLFVDGRRRYEARNAISLDTLDGDDALHDGKGGILEDLERKETVEMVRKALKRMKSCHRAVLTLCDLEGLPYRDAAEEIGVPEGTLRSRLHRAREAFRRQYVVLSGVGALASV